MNKKILLLILIVSLIIPIFSVHGEKGITEEKKILNELKNTVTRIKRKLRETEEYKKTILGEIEEIQSKIKETSVKLSNLEKEINDLSEEVELRQSKIDLLRMKLQRKEEEIGDRIFLLYKMRMEEPWELYFTANSITELLNRVNMLNILIKFTESELENLKKRKEELIKEKEELEERKNLLESKREEVQNLKEKLSKEEEKRNALLNELGEREEEYKKEITILKKRIEEEEKKIQEMIRRAELEKKLPEVGNLIWPVKGPVVSKYGWRIHPIYRTRMFHHGIDIDAKTGTPIKAAADGIVIYSGWLGGYGICVMLKHGGNVATVYGHMQYTKVKLNQFVKQGDIIGYVNNTGLSTGPHLHFEVRIDGKTVDPLKWLP